MYKTNDDYVTVIGAGVTLHEALAAAEMLKKGTEQSLHRSFTGTQYSIFYVGCKECARHPGTDGHQRPPSNARTHMHTHTVTLL